MDSLRIEIEAELKRTRLDKTRLYSLLLKLIDNCGTGGAGGVGPKGPAGPTGPTGPTGPAGPQGSPGPSVAVDKKAAPTPTTAAPTPTKTTPAPDATPKKVPIKKKVVVSA
jgi:hypothetical protein|tara:strand:- start:3629 stop:3961 length:333 start_codon:yes stop_codon:yes gene_type:complete